MNITTQFEMISTWIRARFGETERGATLVEYALLIAHIAVACIVAVNFLSGKAQDNFSSVGNSLGAAS